jgi:hypothetical protein
VPKDTCVNENVDLFMFEGACEAPDDRDHSRNAIENGHLNQSQFDQLTERLIYVATANGMLPSDALAALAKALGTLSTFTAIREGLSLEEVLGASQDSVETFALAAEDYMHKYSEADPSEP